LAPSDLKAMADVRATCATPLAIGKLFSEPREVMPLVEGRLIDFLRVRVSQIGGVTPALKLAQLAAGCGVRVTWHGSGDVSPVGITANVHLSMACPNAVVQEWVGRTELENEMFPGFFDLMQAERGHVRASARPGWGLDFVDNWVWRP
jgi:mannonate dehydratase